MTQLHSRSPTHNEGSTQRLVSRTPRSRDLSEDLPRPVPADQAPPLEVSRDIGWLILVLSATGSLWGSWGLFPNDSVGMWAGYWVSGMTTVAILGAMWLRSYLPKAPAIAATAAAGGTMALLGAVRDYPTSIVVVMVAGGAGIALGALMHTEVRREP